MSKLSSINQQQENQEMEQTKVQIPFAGFYCSLHSDAVDSEFESHLEYIRPDFVEDITDAYNDIMLDVADFGDIYHEYAQKYLDVFANEVGLTMTWDTMVSPREYNFQTDGIFATVPTGQMMAFRAEAGLREGWAQYVRDRCTSRSGFISHYSNDVTDEDWTRTDWDECQYEILFSFAFPDEDNTLTMKIADWISSNELPSVGEAQGKIYERLEAQFTHSPLT